MTRINRSAHPPPPSMHMYIKLNPDWVENSEYEFKLSMLNLVSTASKIFIALCY